MIRHFLFCITIFSFSHIVSADLYSANEALKSGDFAAAAVEFKRLAEQGNVKAQAHLGYMYYVGEGVQQNYEEAVKWYEKAAMQGDRDAQYNLAVAHAFGEGTTQNYQQAASWYLQAAQQGHILAQYSLAISYSYGEGVNQDPKEAAIWFTKAAEQGYERAQVQLGSKYHTGDGVEQDYQQAIKWYRKAADRGNPVAQYNLGSLYRAGKGVDQDYNQALRWFRLAADQGYAAAQNELSSLERSVAAAAASKATPRTRPDPIAKPELTKRQATTPAIAAEETPVEPEQQALFSVDESELLTLDETTTEQVQDEQKQVADKTDMADSQMELEETTESISEALTTQEAIDEEQEILAMDTIEQSLPPISVDEEMPKAIAAEGDEVDIYPDSIETVTDDSLATTDKDTAQTQKQGFFSRLFGEKKEKTATIETEAISETGIETEEIISEPVMEDEEIISKQDVGAEDMVVAEIEESNIETSKTESKPAKRGFFSRLFGKGEKKSEDEDTEIIAETEVDSSDIFEPAQETEDTAVAYAADIEDLTDPTPLDLDSGASEEVVVKKEIDQPRTETSKQSTEISETTPEISVDDAPMPVEQKKSKPGLFSRLFGRSNATESDEMEVATEQAGQDEMDDDVAMVDDSFSRMESEETIPQSEADSATTDIERPEKESRGFFSKLFGKSDSVEKPAESDIETSSQTDEIQLPEIEQPIVKADPEELAGALNALNNHDYDEAYLLYRAMAVRGDPTAQYQLGTLYYQGLGVDQNYEEAAVWYQRSALRGNVNAQYSLGNMYLMGEGREQNDKQASYWYEKAAAQGHASARHNLNNIKRIAREKSSPPEDVISESVQEEIVAYDEEPVYSEPEQKKSRSGFFSKLFGKRDTAQNDDEDEDMDEDGDDIESDPVTKTEKTAEDTSEKKGFFGRLFGKKEEQAIEQTEQASIMAEPTAEQMTEPAIDIPDVKTEPLPSTPVAAYERGLSYAFGDGVPKDNEAAFKWFLQAAEQGYAPAQYKVGTAYAFGDGVTQDQVKAAKWYRMAAERGHSIAQRNLGVMYHNGNGVKQDKPLALAWYSILADNGNVMDIRRRDMLEKELSTEELEQVKQLKEQLSAAIDTSE